MRATRSPTTRERRANRRKRASRPPPIACSACLPQQHGQYLRSLWDEYERGDTAEARYVMAIDRMAPMLLNMAEGGSTWREHGITRDRVIERNGSHIEGALPDVWRLALAQLDAMPAPLD